MSDRKPFFPKRFEDFSPPVQDTPAKPTNISSYPTPVQVVHQTQEVGRPAINIDQVEYRRALDDYLFFKTHHPEMSDKEAMEKSGLSEIKKLESAIINPEKGQTLDFLGPRVSTSGSALHMHPEFQRESSELEVRKKRTLSCFEQIDNQIKKFEERGEFRNKHEIEELLKKIEEFKELQGGVPNLYDHRNIILLQERYLLRNLSFLDLLDILPNLANLDKIAEVKARALIASIDSAKENEEKLHCSFLNTYTKIKDYIKYIEEAEKMNIEMDIVLRKMRIFIENEKKDLMMIPDETLDSFAKTLVKFYELRSRKFHFLGKTPLVGKTPISKNIVSDLKKLWEVFEEILFNYIDTVLPVTEENLKLLEKRYTKMLIFDSIPKFREDHGFQEKMIIYEDFLDNFRKKLAIKKIKALELCQKVFIERKKIPFQENNERIIYAAIDTVCRCPIFKEQLVNSIILAGPKFDISIFESDDIKAIIQFGFKQIGW